MLKLAEKKENLEMAPWVDLAPSDLEHSGEALPESRPQVGPTVVAALADQLAALGVEQAFGVSGGAIALIFDALVDSTIDLHHFRHETGAAFAAAEAYFASGKPSVVFATTGPGLLNSLTGLTAARWDGAKVILVSGATSSPQRGRWATQETSSYTINQDAIYTKGPIFDFAVRMEHAAEFPQVLRRLSLGLASPGGFIAHISLPMGVQSHRLDQAPKTPKLRLAAPGISSQDVELCAKMLKKSPFGIWLGFGARKAAPLVRELVERSGAKVFCSPRGKGIVSERHPQFLGVTGLGGHEEVTDYMLQKRPQHVLVLGTKLGEATSFWDLDLVPEGGFIHVDIDPEVPGTAYPDSETFGIGAEIGHFLEALLPYFPKKSNDAPVDITSRRQQTERASRSWNEPIPMRQRGRTSVRPRVLMDAIQRRVVQEADALVLAECGNSFAWCNHFLRFTTAERYRVSTLFGSMGHTAAGVVGAALARHGKAVAVVGDGSMLMNSEISTAAQYRAPAVWIVLNDAAYGMCRDGHQALGLTEAGVHFPQVDFVRMARALGADGTLVTREEDIDTALVEAMAAEGPFVVDVHIDPSEASPLLKRFESLIKQGNSKNVAGWET
jgi:acetolactate synthase-1/2/3 large subunit